MTLALLYYNSCRLYIHRERSVNYGKAIDIAATGRAACKERPEGPESEEQDPDDRDVAGGSSRTQQASQTHRTVQW